MTINAVPERDDAIVSEDVRTAGKPWLEFFRGVFFALFGWKRSYTTSLVFDFPNILAQSQSKTTVAVKGARAGDAVLVSPTNEVDGLAFDGTVSANDVVQIRAYNYSAGAIDTGSQTYRVIVWQQ
jgi:hypothetical protein